MYRKTIESLKKWKAAARRKPLLLRGARQTGKTYLIRAFAKEHYEELVEVNFEKDSSASGLFDGPLEPRRIVQRLENYVGRRILPGSSLIFFDEIQACPAALTSLKYFQEELGQYHIVCSGSLLGVAVNRKANGKKDNAHSFPVGKVDELRLYPMDFEEFLLARGDALLADTIREQYDAGTPMDGILHDKALGLFREYLVVGGMPESVKALVEEGSFIESDRILGEIYRQYLDDMAKYCTAAEAVRNRACYESLPRQLMKENKNFKYSAVGSGSRSSALAGGVEWIVNMGIALKSRLCKSPRVPLELHASESLFRLYLSDVGLFRHRMRTPINSILTPGYRDDATGLLAENYIACELSAARVPLYYWKGKRNAEIEFMVEHEGVVAPLEVKAGRRVTSKSLDVYRQEHGLSTVFRMSQRNFGMENGIRSVPLYASFCLARELREVWAQ